MKGNFFIIFFAMQAASLLRLEAQPYSFTMSSAHYRAEGKVASGNERRCFGAGVITLYARGSTTALQEIRSPNLTFTKIFQDTDSPSVMPDTSTYEGTPLYFSDFNFDGNEDIAVRNGNQGGYGSPSYDIYLFQTAHKRFVLSKILTKIATENLGMFEIDVKEKRLITRNKSGCCWHLERKYEIVQGSNVRKVFEEEHDAVSFTDGFVKITTRNLVNGKWKVSVKKYRSKEYYQDYD
ncbi:MAG: hypothetical protein EAZ92_02400 [Candidatus Kapaibacterium sp.]|nr:MAG: hypothetical protein EAZ92_02400 [Candidatus Kapabacteria bacterium]